MKRRCEPEESEHSGKFEFACERRAKSMGDLDQGQCGVCGYWLCCCESTQFEIAIFGGEKAVLDTWPRLDGWPARVHHFIYGNTEPYLSHTRTHSLDEKSKKNQTFPSEFEIEFLFVFEIRSIRDKKVHRMRHAALWHSKNGQATTDTSEDYLYIK